VAALVLENLKALIPVFPFVRVLSLEAADVEVVEVRVTESSPLVNKKVGETGVAFLAETACLVRAGSAPQMVGESTRLLVGDSLICVIPRDLLDKLRAEVGEPGPSVP
jgi:Trk K+ transport system NAD-binding subunit